MLGDRFPCVSVLTPLVAATTVSLLVLLEPVLSPVWAWMVHGEKPTSLALIGGGIIVVATAFYTWSGESPDHTRQ